MLRRRGFQTGTLGRSVRRFGRFPRFGRTGFARKKFSHYYSSLTGQLEITGSPDAFLGGIVTNADLIPAASQAAGAQIDVSNLSFDMVIALQCSPELIASTSQFGHLGVLWGIYKQDVDEDTTTIDQVFATNSLIKWGYMPVSIYSANGSVSVSANPTLVQVMRQRFRVSKLKFDEELVFIANWDETESLTGQLDAAFITINQRVRYEVP